ncbi:MAG: NUDIX hydrolase [Cytophagaceae bacterium]|nr:NUDIX hydrolase [Cytophagaceae bacterium]MBK9510720.1 NUDIX hydrolase [Cytophagaceae bacterium]MBK9932989.1 NUDIX hydrolase [Cytophagaceae bacterium]MBL0303298.1 NUDIX hydrolase [Cytophagaceae bacterium]MBL0326147.1 NUDIX hydrolase [Cytophagaceae bacterium]
MMNLDEEHFIPQLSIDSVIFGYWDSRLKVLIAKVKMDYDIWTLPGGFIQQREHIDAAAMRILEERTGLNKIYLEQFRVFGAENRVNDSFQEKVKTWQNIGSNFELEKMLRWFSKRFVSIGYYALVDINKVSLRKGEFDNSVEWYDIENLPVMIMDHNEMVNFALEKLREKLDEKLIGFNLLPETFTMRELQELYEAVYDRPFPRNNFQKKMLDLNVLERLEKVYTGAANKAPFLYRFRKGD